jgi:hypothetical protein
MTAMKNNTVPVEGDTIQSAVFAHARFTSLNRRELLVDPAIQPHTVGELSAYDKSRETAIFVVEKSGWNDTDTTYAAHHNTDAKFINVALREWVISARRLKNNTDYDVHGEIITFYTTGCSFALVREHQIQITGKMQKIFVPEEQSKIISHEKK